MRRRRKSSRGWHVEITNATTYCTSFYSAGGYVKEVTGKVAVTICYDGSQKMSYGTLSINDTQFEDKVTTMKAEAEERAAALMAVGATA